jgi:hypothetical protein
MKRWEIMEAPHRARGSKIKLHRQLNNTRLIAITAAHVRLVYCSEGSAGESAIRLRLVKVERVGNVEDLGTELDSGTFRDSRSLV